MEIFLAQQQKIMEQTMKQNEANQKFFLTQMKPISELMKGKQEILVERALPPLEKKIVDHAKEAKLIKE